MTDGVDTQGSALEDEILIEGIMAAGALIALADEKIKIDETLTLENMLNGPELLKRYDLEKALQIYTFYLGRLSSDFSKGKEEALEAISLCKEDIGGPALILQGGLAVAQADNELSDSEVSMLEEICQAMGVEGFDSLGLVGRRPIQSN